MDELVVICNGISHEASREKWERCPTCNSPSPELHPAMQYEGEVELCHHEFHTKGNRTVIENGRKERLWT